MSRYKRLAIEKISAEQQLKNFNNLKTILKKYIVSDRIQDINTLLDTNEESIVMSPASSHDHGSYFGGLVEHMLDTIKSSLYMRALFKKMGLNTVPSEESCVFAAAFHDIGKIGTEENEYYIVEDSDWHRKNMNRNFKINYDRPLNLHHADNSLYILQKHNIHISAEEYQAIRIHDGNGADINRWNGYAWDIDLLSHIIRLSDYLAASFRREENIESVGA